MRVGRVGGHDQSNDMTKYVIVYLFFLKEGVEVGGGLAKGGCRIIIKAKDKDGDVITEADLFLSGVVLCLPRVDGQERPEVWILHRL